MESVVGQATQARPVEDTVTDWYLPEGKAAEGWVYPGMVPVRDNERLTEIAREMAVLCQSRPGEDFVIKHGARLFRGHRISSVEGTLLALRRVPSMVPPIDKLGLPPAVQGLLLHEKLSRGGLVIIAGETGQGKSTTAGATIRARVERFGSFCLTVEDPPELPLHGRIGKSGMVVQTDVRAGNFGDALRGAMRSYPTQGNSILFLGETRDPETASQVLQIATNGHLVITTIHGEDLISSTQRFLSLARAHPGMTETEARSVFSSAVRLILHQKLSHEGGRRQLQATILFSGDRSSPVANRVRQGSVEGLSTDVQQQQLLLKSGNVNQLLSMFDSQASTR
jgi:Tfp pilus assembly pilus retraction ATPase PilT